MPTSGGGGRSGRTPVDPLSRPQRLVAGILVLLLVDVIWVASSEFTKYIFTDLNFDKPFFTTYFKTGLFMTYLFGFLIYKPWRDQCGRDAGRLRDSVRRQQGRYRRILQHDTGEYDGDESERDILSSSGEGDDDEDPTAISYGTAGVRSSSSRDSLRSLGSPILVPANIPSESGKSSETGDSDIEIASSHSINSTLNDSNSTFNQNGEPGGDKANTSQLNENRSRHVRFKHLAEVVEMNSTEGIAANLSRLSYNASLRAHAALRRAASRLTAREVMKLSLAFTIPWFAGNYCYQHALAETEAAVVNILSASSCIFTLLLAGVFPSEPGDRITLSKMFAVCFNFSGVVLVSYADIKDQQASQGNIAIGVIWALFGAFFYSVYIVLLRRKVQNEDNMDPPMFFGFVGLFSTVLLWPVLLLLHAIGQERFEMPNLQQWEFLVVNGVIGTVLSELLWLLGCFYTSSLIATLSIGLTIPLSILADIIWKQKSYHAIFVVGTIPMFCSFFVIALLTHYQDWDPLLDLCKYTISQCRILFCCVPCSLRSGYQRPSDRIGNSGYIFDRQERESLIQQNNCDGDSELMQAEMLFPSANDTIQQDVQSDRLPTQQNNDNRTINNKPEDIGESEPM